MFSRTHIADDVENPADADSQLPLRPLSRPTQRGYLFFERDAPVRAVMRVWRKGDFAAQYALRSLPAQEFARDEFDVLRRADAGRNGQIDFDEVREVSKRVPFPQTFDCRGGQRHAVALGEQKQSFRLDRAFEVNVKFDLRHAADECG